MFLLQWNWLSWHIFISIRTGHLVERNAVSVVPISAKIFVLRSLCLSQLSSNTPPAFIHESYISQDSCHHFRFSLCVGLSLKLHLAIRRVKYLHSQLALRLILPPMCLTYSPSTPYQWIKRPSLLQIHSKKPCMEANVLRLLRL